MTNLSNVKSITITLIAIIACVFPLSLSAAEIIAKVDGVEISRSDMILAQQDIGRTLPKRMRSQQRRAYLINYLIDLQLAARKAEQEKLQNSPEFQKKMAYFRKKALMETFMDDVHKNAATELKINNVYLKASKSHKPEPEVHAKHILVATRAEAEAALKRLAKGENFAKIAKEISKDPGSPGGDLGWFTKKKMVPTFAEMAFRTKVGQISEPVKSRFGWHIIKVEGSRTTRFPPLSKIRGQITRYLTHEAQSNAIKALRSTAKIERTKSQK